MAFEFSKTEAAMVNGAVIALREKSAAVQAAVEAFNATVHEELSALNTLVGEYNTELTSIRETIESIHSEAQSEFDDKSERWQEGERAESVQEWMNELESIELDDAEEYEVEPLADFDPAHASALEELPAEPSY